MQEEKEMMSSYPLDTNWRFSVLMWFAGVSQSLSLKFSRYFVAH
jgi:hypothetical protein